jgi:hypothetical protein
VFVDEADGAVSLQRLGPQHAGDFAANDEVAAPARWLLQHEGLLQPFRVHVVGLDDAAEVVLGPQRVVPKARRLPDELSFADGRRHGAPAERGVLGPCASEVGHELQAVVERGLVGAARGPEAIGRAVIVDLRVDRGDGANHWRRCRQ